MKLSSLLHVLNLNNPLENDPIILDITDDSRTAKAGTLFLAPGNITPNAKEFILSALKNGASAVITNLDINAPNIIRADLSDKLIKTKISKAFFPKQPENIYAVTGTNGKTSTVHFVRQILTLLGKKAASLGTLGIGFDLNGYNLSKDKQPHSTPGAVEMHKTLHTLKEQGIDYLAMEAASHGIDQLRMESVKVKAAAFTNLTPDHLDYHITIENYLNTKLRLFKELLPEKSIAVANRDIPEYDKIKEISLNRKLELVDFGKNAECIKLLDLNALPSGMHIKFRYFNKEYELDLNLAGEFQAYNVLTALGLLKHELQGIDLNEILPHLTSVLGRMEKVEVDNRNIYVDYAHTPDALERVITMLKKHTKHKVITVFGCGGDRDKGRRSGMGAIANKYSDIVIITDDNPRNEDPNEIRKEILLSVPNGIEIASRKEAIYHAVKISNPEDVILIAGKGHEKYQIIGKEILDFDDVQIAQEACKQNDLE